MAPTSQDISSPLPFFQAQKLLRAESRHVSTLKTLTRCFRQCFNMFQHVSTCFDMFRHVSTCFGCENAQPKPISPCTYPSIHLSVYPSIHLSIYIYIYIYLSLAIYLTMILSISLSIYLPVSVYLYLSTYLFS